MTQENEKNIPASEWGANEWRRFFEEHSLSEAVAEVMEHISQAVQAERQKCVGTVRNALDNYALGLIAIPNPQISIENLKTDILFLLRSPKEESLLPYKTSAKHIKSGRIKLIA